MDGGTDAATHDAQALEQQVEALEEGWAVLDLDGWRATEVAGSDAGPWLQDLVTTSIDALEPGIAVRSFLLSPTGRIRADVLVLRDGELDAFVLLQTPGQPTAVVDLLVPYVLSSAVTLSVPDRRPVVIPSSGATWHARFDDHEPPGVVASPAAFESWRIRTGIARFPHDLDEASLPAEAGLDVEPVIDRSKGCYLGQEAVARVRNLGHPPRVVLGVVAGGVVHVGDRVLSKGSAVGMVTSVDRAGGERPAALIRVRWGAAEGSWSTEAGIDLLAR